MKKLDRILNFFEVYVNGIILLIMCLIIFLQIIFRFSGMSLVWTEETARYMFVWIIYLSVSQAVKEKRHLSVDLLPLVLKDRGKVVVRIISNILGFVFFILITYYGIQVIRSFIERPQYSQAIHLNMIVPYLAPYAGAVFACLRYVEDTILAVRELKTIGKNEIGEGSI